MEAHPHGCSESAYNRTYPDDRRASQKLISGLHPDDYYDDTPPKLRVSPSSKFRKYHCGANHTRKLHAKSSQMLWNQNSPPRADATRSQSQSQTRRDLNKTSILNSLLYYRVFSIISIHVQVWLHLIRIYKICYMYMFFVREKN